MQLEHLSSSGGNMSRGLLFSDGFKPQFSGHETFPLRYGWLKKAYDAVSKAELNSNAPKGVFSSDDAIADFGVGKNMVTSIRHWAVACDIIEEIKDKSGSYHTTALGKMLFDDNNGVDPFLESLASLWLIHWQLSGTPSKTTTWYWVYNHYPNRNFDRDHLSKGLLTLCQHLNLQKIAPVTIKRDVECFIRTYVSKGGTEHFVHEDNLECPLTELSLIKPMGKRDGFQTARGPKSTLPDSVFIYALLSFWENFTHAKTLSFEAILYEPGSPGRIFLLDENDLNERLVRVSDVTSGAIQWSETAGLRQLIMRKQLSQSDALSIVQSTYPLSHKRSDI